MHGAFRFFIAAASLAPPDLRPCEEIRIVKEYLRIIRKILLKIGVNTFCIIKKAKFAPRTKSIK